MALAPEVLFLRPQPKPDFLRAPVVAAAPDPEPVAPQRQRKASMRGAVCGLAAVKGEALPPMRSTQKGCGIAEPVTVTEIAGVALSPPPTMNCELAGALEDWVSGDLQRAFGGRVTKLQVADSYSCRPRNNVRGNPPSVHGKGEAIDFSAVVVGGKAVEVKSRLDRRWQKARKAGCGDFSVILGPGSDGYHENHIHFDVSDHGGDPYCK